MSRKLLVVLAFVFAFAIVAFAGDKSSPDYECPLDKTLRCVMDSLDSPRGLAFGPEGALYVVEAGIGAGPVANAATDPRCAKIGPATVCYGPTGAVTRLWRGRKERIVTGLPSLAMPGKGNRGLGAADIAFLGRGHMLLTIGLEGDPLVRTAHPLLPELQQFGKLLQVSADGELREIADIGNYELDHGVFDTDPFGVLAEPGGAVLVDSGANSLLRVDANGQVSLMATFPSRNSTPPRKSNAPPPFDKTNPTTDAVPTTVTTGPDGAYYIGELTGIPFVDKQANIYRLDPATDVLPRTFKVEDAFLSGFKNILDIAFDPEGTLYVLQYSTGAVQMTNPGVLLKVVPDKTKSTIVEQYQKGTRSTVLAGLTQATSVVVGPDGDVYVTIRGSQNGGGEVIRIEP